MNARVLLAIEGVKDAMGVTRSADPLAENGGKFGAGKDADVSVYGCRCCLRKGRSASTNVVQSGRVNDGDIGTRERTWMRAIIAMPEDSEVGDADEG